MAEDTIKIPVEIDANTEKLSAKLQSTIARDLALGVEQAISRILPKATQNFRGMPGLFAGMEGPGQLARFLLSEGSYAPTNAVSLAMRNAYDVFSKLGYDMSDPEMMKIKAYANAAAHHASDAKRQARVAGTYDNLIDLYNVAVRTAEYAATPEERKAALTLAASYKQSLGNRSYVTSGLIDPEQSVANRMAAIAIRGGIDSIQEDRVHQEQLVWEAEQRRVKEIEVSNMWNSLLGEQERYETESLAQKTAEDARNKKIRGEQTAWEAEQRRIKEIEVSNTWNSLLGEQERKQAVKAEQEAKAAKQLRNFSEALVDAGKVVTVFGRTATEIMQGEWEISRDLIDPVRTRRAVRQQQAQKYGKAVSNFGSSVLAGSAATGNVLGMVAGGVLVAGGEVANYLGSQYEQRRLTAETYAERTFDYNSRRMLYGPNINYNTALAAGMSGYTSADAVLNLDTTGTNLRGAMAFGAVSENQMMALSLMPNYWRTLMDPNSSTEDKLAAYASDINSLPEDYQAYINSILPGGDESLRAYTKSGVYGALQAGYATNAQGDALFQQYTAAWEAVQAQKAMQSRTKAIADYAGDTPKLLAHEYSAMNMTTGNVPGLTEYYPLADAILERAGITQEQLRAERDKKVYNLTVNVGGEEAGKTSFSEKDFESGMSYTLGV